jgi:hypothetical protein
VVSGRGDQDAGQRCKPTIRMLVNIHTFCMLLKPPAGSRYVGSCQRTASGGVPRRSIAVVGEVAHLLLCQLIDNSMALLPIVAAGIMLLIRAATCTCPPLAPSRPGCWTCYKSGPTLGQESGVLGESGADAAPSSGDGLWPAPG